MLGVLSVMGADGQAARRGEGRAADGPRRPDRRRRRAAPCALLAKADAEAEAAAARATLAALVENAPFAVSMTDRDLRLLQVSRRWREERGLVGADVIGRSIYDIFPNVELGRRARAGPGRRDPAAGGAARPCPTVAHPGCATSTRPGAMPSGQIGGILSMSVEVTELVEALHKAEASEKRLKLAMEIGDLAMWEMDLRRETMTAAGVNPVPTSGPRLDFFEIDRGGRRLAGGASARPSRR